MKRCYQNIIAHKDGTLSGVCSMTFIERLSIFTDSVFTLSGYYEASERELIELLFLFYVMPDGMMPRRIFERCRFSFIGFTRTQIDDVMHKLSCYSFIDCKVLEDGIEISDYPLYEDMLTRRILASIPDYIKEAARKYNRESVYNLSKMTVNTKHGDSHFKEAYHQWMKLNRATRYKKPRLLLIK